MDKQLYGMCCNYAYRVITKINFKNWRSQDIVNDFFFETEVTEYNYKQLVHQSIKKLKITEHSQYVEHLSHIQLKVRQNAPKESQCSKCGKVKPIDYFYIAVYRPSKKCRDCIKHETNREYAIKSVHRLLSKRNKDIAAIDDLIRLLNEKKDELLATKKG